MEINVDFVVLRGVEGKPIYLHRHRMPDAMDVQVFAGITFTKVCFLGGIVNVFETPEEIIKLFDGLQAK